MTIEEIKKLIFEDESRILELKKSTGELKDGMKSACAFLNSDGGWLIFGVTPLSLNLVGQQVTDNTLREISREITKIEPAIELKPEYIDIDDKPGYKLIALHLNAWPRGTAPYTYDNRPYYRVESTTKVMPRDLFEERIKESKPHLFSWERQTSDGINIDDLDNNLIVNAVRGGVKGGRLSSSALSETTENILSKFQLLNQGKPNNAAVALFAKESGLYTQLELRMARFKGNGKNEFGDNQRVSGNFFKLFDAGMSFFFKHLNLSGKIVGTKREEELEVPYVALREALTNALCHRMYDDVGPSVGIAIYDDRIEISNPGTLPSNLTVENIKQSHDSYPRNPLMANVLYLSMYLEKWGSGVSRIIEACEQQGLPEPTYEVRGGFVYIIFKRSSYIGGNDTQNVVENVVENVGDNFVKVVDKIVTISDSVLYTISENNSITTKKLAEQYSMSMRQMQRIIAQLKDDNRIKRIGPDKGGHWEIIE